MVLKTCKKLQFCPYSLSLIEKFGVILLTNLILKKLGKGGHYHNDVGTDEKPKGEKINNPSYMAP